MSDENLTVLQRYLVEWSLEVLAIFRQHAIREAGLDSRSSLVRGFDYEVKPTEVAILAKDYIKFVESGRASNREKPGIRKVPFAALKEWARRYRVRPRPGQTEQEMIYRIQSAILVHGIRPRPFSEGAIEESVASIDPYLNIWLGNLGEDIGDAFHATQNGFRRLRWD